MYPAHLTPRLATSPESAIKFSDWPIAKPDSKQRVPDQLPPKADRPEPTKPIQIVGVSKHSIAGASPTVNSIWGSNMSSKAFSIYAASERSDDLARDERRPSFADSDKSKAAYQVDWDVMASTLI